MKDSVVNLMVRHHYTLTGKLFAKEKTISKLGEITIDEVNACLRKNKEFFYTASLKGSSRATIMYSYNDIETLPPMRETANVLGVMKRYVDLPCFLDVEGRIIQDLWLGEAFKKYCPRITLTPDFPELPEEYHPEAKYLYLWMCKYTGPMSENQKKEIITKLFTKGVIRSFSTSKIRKLMLKLKSKKLVVRSRDKSIYFANLFYLKKVMGSRKRVIDKNLEK